MRQANCRAIAIERDKTPHELVRSGPMGWQKRPKKRPPRKPFALGHHNQRQNGWCLNDLNPRQGIATANLRLKIHWLIISLNDLNPRQGIATVNLNFA